MQETTKKGQEKKIKFKDRPLPKYSVAEERINYITHIVGAVFGAFLLVFCIIRSAFAKDPWAITGSSIYGASMIILYTMSSIYHALPKCTGKKVMQILDHCTIYLLIAGTYTPILLSSIRQTSPVWAWAIFGIVWGLCAFATVFTAIDLKKYSKLSMICYICMGWCIIIATGVAIESIGLTGFIWLLSGGAAYTIGAVLYGIGKKKKYIHSVFHFFVLLGSILQAVCVYFYVLP